jgi:syringate O-demethylase/vanillate/3-O-methylgallate O-demethylase
VANWVQYQAQTGGYDVKVDRDERTRENPKPRKTFRFEIQGPDAWKLLEKLNGSAIDQPKFFQMGKIRIAGRELPSLRHGMGGAPGLEIWGPVEQGPEVKAAILEAGKEFDLRQVGARAYSTTAVDSGWLGCVMPAIYSDEETRPYREWLPADSYDGRASLGGSFVSENIEDYYYSPWDLDYGRLIRFDHEFVGRKALEEMAQRPHRCKVSLVWNADDVAGVFRSFATPGLNGKFIEMPDFHYSTNPYDKVLDARENVVGVSTYGAFLAPDGAWVSLAVVDEKCAATGNELTIVWGEPEHGSRRPVVESHVLMPVRATVSGWPFSSLAQKGYRPARA